MVKYELLIKEDPIFPLEGEELERLEREIRALFTSYSNRVSLNLERVQDVL